MFFFRNYWTYPEMSDKCVSVRGVFQIFRNVTPIVGNFEINFLNSPRVGNVCEKKLHTDYDEKLMVLFHISL